MLIRELNEAISKALDSKKYLLREDFNSSAIYAINSLATILKKRLLDMKAEAEELTKIVYKDRRESQKNRFNNIEYLADALRDGHAYLDGNFYVPGLKQTEELKSQLERYYEAIQDGKIKTSKIFQSLMSKLLGELASFNFNEKALDVFYKHVDEIVSIIDKLNKGFDKVPYNPNVDMSIVQESLTEGMKRYACVWAEDAYQGEHFAIVNSSFFTKEAGYSDKDISAIENLSYGELYTVIDIADDHHVIRLTD